SEVLLPFPGRGARVDLALPEGVAVRLPPSARLVVRQRIRNEYWLAPGTAENPGTLYRNQTTGASIVNLHTVPVMAAEARPFIDTTGTGELAVPPGAEQVTVGA